jgi:hypothetical protein
MPSGAQARKVEMRPLTDSSAQRVGMFRLEGRSFYKEKNLFRPLLWPSGQNS